MGFFRAKEKLQMHLQSNGKGSRRVVALHLGRQSDKRKVPVTHLNENPGADDQEFETDNNSTGPIVVLRF